MDEIESEYPIKQEIIEDMDLDPLVQIKLEVSSDEETEIQEEIFEARDEITQNSNFCSRCDKTFGSSLETEKHQQGCSLTCVFCGILFMSEIALEQHENTHLNYSRIHENEFKCSRCNEVFSQRSSLVQHQQKVCTVDIPFQCVVCSKKFKYFGTLKAHQRVHLSEQSSDSILLKCSLCSQVFDSRDELQEHDTKCTGNTSYPLKRKHKEKPVGMLSCNECKKIFPAVDDWIAHNRIHKNQINKCSACDREFSTGSSLKIHEMWCTGQFKCVACNNRTFKTFNALRFHEINDHARKQSSYNIQFKCTFCSEVFDTQDELLEHINTKCIKRPSYTCSVCQTSFSRLKYLESHKLMHEKTGTLLFCVDLPTEHDSITRQNKQAVDMTCSICCQTFSEISTLEKHRELCNKSTPCFPCSECDMKFKELGSLNKHKEFHDFCKESVDANKVQIKCEVCSQTFAKTKEYSIHKKEHLVLKCKRCDQEFKGKHSIKSLRNHERSFCKKRNLFLCSACNLTFSRENDLLLHIKVHDPKSLPK